MSDNYDDFELPSDVSAEITVDDKTATYLFRELPASRMAEIMQNLSGPDNPRKEKYQREAQARLISESVKRADGRAISFEEASKLRSRVARALEAKILDINGLSPKAADEAKNEQ